MTLETYLADKKIDAAEFEKQDPQRYHEWAQLLEKMHPASFTAQKLYLINSTRRKYPLGATDKLQPHV